MEGVVPSQPCAGKNIFLKIVFLKLYISSQIYISENTEILTQDSKIEPIIQVILHVSFIIETTIPWLGKPKSHG